MQKTEYFTTLSYFWVYKWPISVWWSSRPNHAVKRFLYQGCSMTIYNKLLVTIVGLKHFFSSFLAIRLVENKIETVEIFPKLLIGFSNLILMLSYWKVTDKQMFLQRAFFVKLLLLMTGRERIWVFVKTKQMCWVSGDMMLACLEIHS